jgi:restriction endonuclease S subunit
LAFVDEFQASKLANVALEAGDVLLNITGASVARVCICPADILPARVNQHVAIIRLRDKRLNQFVAASLKMPAMKAKLLGIAESGATRQAITKTQIEELSLPMPPSEQILRFNSATEQYFQVRAGVINSLNSEKTLFSSLQHRAFSGQL